MLEFWTKCLKQNTLTFTFLTVWICICFFLQKKQDFIRRQYLFVYIFKQTNWFSSLIIWFFLKAYDRFLHLIEFSWQSYQQNRTLNYSSITLLVNLFTGQLQCLPTSLYRSPTEGTKLTNLLLQITHYQDDKKLIDKQSCQCHFENENF